MTSSGKGPATEFPPLSTFISYGTRITSRTEPAEPGEPQACRLKAHGDFFMAQANVQRLWTWIRSSRNSAAASRCIISTLSGR